MTKSLREMTAYLMLMAAWALPVRAQTDKLPEWTPEDKEFVDKAAKLNAEASRLFGAGMPKEAAEKFAAVIEIRQKLYTKERFPNGHIDIAIGLNNMGLVLLTLEESDKALLYFEQALVVCQKLYPKKTFPIGHPDLAIALNSMSYTLASLGEPGKALPYCQQALGIRQNLYPEELFPDGHSDVARSLNDMAHLLESLGELGKSLTYREQTLAMCQKLYPKQRYPDGHSDVARSLDNLGYVLQSLGDPGKALPYHEQALEMCLKLYSKERNGHPELARSLGFMGSVLQSLGESGKALPYHERSLAMWQKLFPKERAPNGHPGLALSLNSMGGVLESLGEFSKALPYFEQALMMNQKLHPKRLFPDGHPQLAMNFNNLGYVLQSLGESGKARSYYEQALMMNQKLYPNERFPDGHPALATSLFNMGSFVRSLGELDKALTFYEQALEMYQNLSRRESGLGSEAQALAYRQAQPHIRDGYLWTSLLGPTTKYGVVWHGRGELLPLLQARHQQMLILTRQSKELRKQYEQLGEVRQQIARLQTSLPKSAVALKARDKELAQLIDEQDRLERKLAAMMPEFKHLRELADKKPADLAAILPRSVAFVDLILNNHYNRNKEIDGRRYVAFVLLPSKEPRLIDLGDAKPIDEAAVIWRGHIEKMQPSLAPAKLRELVWDKIGAVLPAETKIVYLCPDGDLARIPFAALPGKKKGTILLEDHAVAVVPSGPWLLGQFLYPPSKNDAPDRVLAVGDVIYGRSDSPKDDYAALPGSGRELKRVLEAFGQQSDDALSGAGATAAAVRLRLPTVRYAHFATHGYFNEKELSAERLRLKKTLSNWTFDTGSQLGGMGVRNSAVFTGLVFAGANNPAKDDKDHGILTGLNLLDVPLEHLRLCVLSACETGLGDLTEAEGVLGLQRSFHAAGCPNVIGTLWKVDDRATAALMTQFYHELRAKKRPPLEALREAQLTIYRHPERIGDLAGIRGKVVQDNAVKGGSTPAAPGVTANATPVRLWAAFILSGRGE